MRRRRSKRAVVNAAFTLLEVMVAVAILAVSFSAIFSSEAGAIKMAARSRKMGTAALLARCKMGEIEEQIAEEGLPAIFDSGSDGCCEEAEIDGYSCDWEIQPVTLPETMFMPEEGEGGEGDESASQPGGQLAEMSPEEMLSGGGAASADGMAMMAMGFIYPALKASFESQIRRATVTVKWTEGERERSFDVTQFVVSGEPVELLEGLPMPGEEQGAPGATGTGTGTGSTGFGLGG
ncbi:MAG: type II secretion system protein [Myxococcales bacterium]|nr:type II secretion system protein [Myxococcales bacterium]